MSIRISGTTMHITVVQHSVQSWSVVFCFALKLIFYLYSNKISTMQISATLDISSPAISHKFYFSVYMKNVAVLLLVISDHFQNWHARFLLV